MGVVFVGIVIVLSTSLGATLKIVSQDQEDQEGEFFASPKKSGDLTNMRESVITKSVIVKVRFHI